MDKNIKNAIATYFIGSLFYLPGLALNSWAGGQWLDINEIYFIPAIVLSILFLFSSVAWVNPKPLYYGIASSLIFLFVMFSIPNVAYPIGSSYYELVEIGFSRVSGFFYAIATMFFLYIILERDGKK